MTETEEIAKAIQETAKVAQRGMEITEKAAGFFAKVLGGAPDEVAAMVIDKLRFVRWKRLMRMSDEVDQILSERGIGRTRSVPPKLALPIFEDASLEEEPDIQNLWNHLLANAMDRNFNSEIRYGFIDMIRAITAREAQLLSQMYSDLEKNSVTRPLSDLSQHYWDKEELMEKVSLSADEYVVAANNLMRMQLVSAAIFKGGISIGVGQGSDKLTVYKGIDAITMTGLGVLFVEACTK